MSGLEYDHFTYENPNYDSREQNSRYHEAERNRADLGASGGGGEELNNSVDLYYERNDTVWTEPSDRAGAGVGDNGNARSAKYRKHYARMGADDMGVPNSPSVDRDDEEERFSDCVKRNDDYSPSSSAGGRSSLNSDNTKDEEIIEEIHDVWYKHTKENKRISRAGDVLVIGRDRASSTERGDRSRYSPISATCRSLDSLVIDTDTAMFHPHHHYYARQHPTDDSAVDYSPHDFRRSFAVIDQAAKEKGADGGGGGGGLRMRKEMDDVTVVTEHRDPYSFYWQLDKVRKPEEPVKRDAVTENVIEEIAVEESTQVQSPDSHDSGIHVEYTRPSKPVKPIIERFAKARAEQSPKRKLPPGWERHEDPSGFSYYWHVDSGTVQREPPKTLRVHRAVIDEEQPLYEPKLMSMLPRSKPHSQSALVKTHRSMANHRVHVESAPTVDVAQRPPLSQAVQTLPQPPPPQQQPIIIERAFKQTTTKRRIENDTSEDKDEVEDGGPRTPVRFAVRSLGWTEISEEDLTPERSSRAVNKAIVDLSTGRNDLIDNVSKWGDGKELIMELDDHDLRLIDPDSGTVLHTQPIHQIRVWGVGRDNGRDFAYVARDRMSRRFMCHVFRCDTPARTIANTLRGICKRLMMERRPTTLQTSTMNGTKDGRHSATANGSRPGSRYGVEHNDSGTGRRSVARDPFPTPMEEPKKVIRCHFLGVTQVPRATGIEILNEAVDRLVAQVRTERWILVDASIAPSTITVTEVGGNQIAECRVRYLSFLGIGRDIKHCAFIMNTAADNFMCYVFHVEPSAGAMAKTIEAACKLRYQKVLDAHGERRMNGSKGLGDAIRNVFGSIAGHRSPRTSKYPS